MNKKQFEILAKTVIETLIYSGGERRQKIIDVGFKKYEDAGKKGKKKPTTRRERND